MPADARTILFVLGSASPRRRDLLAQIGYHPDSIDPPEIDEHVVAGETPGAYARRIAAEKHAAIAGKHPGALILCADTVVACGRQILPKAEDPDTAAWCLRMLSGRRHAVYGGVFAGFHGGPTAHRLVTTKVAFKRLTERELRGYLSSGEWLGKAGGYAIQGRAAALISWVGGSYSNVVGLPLYQTAALLTGLGLYPDWQE